MTVKINNRRFRVPKGKREDGIYWNLQGNKEDFSWQFISMVEDDLLPTKNIEYKLKILNLLNENEKGLSLKEIVHL